MTREEHIENLKAIASDMPSDKCADWIESLMAGVKALEQEPCSNCISREATVEKLCKIAEIMNKKREGLGSPYVMAALFIQDNKDEFPPVTPQPKMGKWKRINKEKYVQHAMSYYRCSECGEEIIGEHNYCPNCGTKMENEI